MSSWLEQLERELDARLSAFLRNNPVQDNLFSEQHLKDRAGALQRQRQQLQGEAKQQRQQLLRLAEDVRAWRSRVDRAQAAGAADLAERAAQHLGSLMNQGRALWADLEDLGRRFTEVEQQLEELRQQQQTPSPQRWRRTGRCLKRNRSWSCAQRWSELIQALGAGLRLTPSGGGVGSGRRSACAEARFRALTVAPADPIGGHLVPRLVVYSTGSITHPRRERPWGFH